MQVRGELGTRAERRSLSGRVSGLSAWCSCSRDCGGRGSSGRMARYGAVCWSRLLPAGLWGWEALISRPIMTFLLQCFLFCRKHPSRLWGGEHLLPGPLRQQVVLPPSPSLLQPTCLRREPLHQVTWPDPCSRGHCPPCCAWPHCPRRGPRLASAFVQVSSAP